MPWNPQDNDVFPLAAENLACTHCGRTGEVRFINITGSHYHLRCFQNLTNQNPSVFNVSFHPSKPSRRRRTGRSTKNSSATRTHSDDHPSQKHSSPEFPFGEPEPDDFE